MRPRSRHHAFRCFRWSLGGLLAAAVPAAGLAFELDADRDAFTPSTLHICPSGPYPLL